MIPKIKKPKISVPSTIQAKSIIKKFIPRPNIYIIVYTFAFVVLGFFFYQVYKENKSIESEIAKVSEEKINLTSKLNESERSYEALKNEDQYLKNKALQEEIDNIQSTYKKAVSVYEDLLDLKDKSLPAQAGKDTQKLDAALANAFTLLSQKNYTQSLDILNTLSADIKKKTDEINASYKIPENIVASNTPPGFGYQRQKVNTQTGVFMVDIISADIGSTKVIVDTASDSDCGNDCPTLPLSEYAKRTGAYAGVNGSYFCPSTYPSCAGKTNTFDLLAMNYKKTYFNSGNNVYSNNPAVIFGDSYVRFVSHASEWGRDTSPNGVLSNYPLLLFNSNISYSGDGDPKHSNYGGRSFVANKGNTVYIGVVYSATVLDSANVMKALGFENAINLDDGGSTALWYGGYKAGPGRNIPNAILFVKK